MITRNYHIQVKLEIHAITCPGVCLCPNGGVELTIRTLGYFLTTNQRPPRFPIIYHDTFYLEGYFKTVNSLMQLEDSLRNEKVDIAMWQNGRRLSHCCKTLYSFLIDRSFKAATKNYNKLLEMNGNVLMTPSSCFPGIIGPRVEYTSSVKLLEPDYDLDERNNVRKEHCCCRKRDGQTCESPRLKETCDAKNARIKEFRRQKPVCHYSENNRDEKGKRYHSEKQHRNFSHKNFESKKIHCDCVCDFDDSSSVNILVENHSHQQYQYPHQTMASVPTHTKSLKSHENFNELKTVTNTAQKISEEMYKTPALCRQQWQAIIRKYKSLTEKRSGSGMGDEAPEGDIGQPNRWPYFDIIHQYASSKDNFHPPNLSCSLEGLTNIIANDSSSDELRELEKSSTPGSSNDFSISTPMSTHSSRSQIIRSSTESRSPSTSRPKNKLRTEEALLKESRKIGQKISSALTIFGQLVQKQFPDIDVSSLLISESEDSS